MREASSGQQSLATITEEAEEGQQALETVTKEAEKEPRKTGTRKKDKPSAEPLGLSPFSSDKLMGSRAFSTYCEARKETVNNQGAIIHFFHEGVMSENQKNDQRLSANHLEKSSLWFNNIQ